MKKAKVFVYGSLLAGLGNHHLLEGSECLFDTYTDPEFTMFSLGTFPAICEGGQTSIYGQVYEVDEETLAALDRLEGHPRFYRRTLIWLHGGTTSAYTYLLPPERITGRKLPEVSSGSWLGHLREQGEIT